MNLKERIEVEEVKPSALRIELSDEQLRQLARYIVKDMKERIG